MITLWLTIVLLGVVGWVIYQFNTLVGLSNDIDEAWAQIDSQFIRRYELVARLLDLAKAQPSHNELAAARTAAMNAYTPSEKSRTEPPLAAAIAAVQLDGNEEFSQMKQTFADIENYLRTAGRRYNALVDELNARAGSFPNNFLASLFGVELRERFQPGGTVTVALTVAGSDSGGGAGIQADLKTFHTLGVFGTTAITAITCQNPRQVSAVQRVEPRIVAGQIERILEAFPVRAAKTGMLYDAGIINRVAATFRAHRFHNVVVDPVMIASSGARLLQSDAVSALCRRLLPLAAVVTPNLMEAETLAQCRISSLHDLRAAARTLTDRHGVPFLVKGGHLRDAKRAVDVLCDGRKVHEFSAPVIPHIRTHGTGCTYSAAIAANLALGYTLVEAVGRAKIFVTRAIRNALRIGKFDVLRI